MTVKGLTVRDEASWRRVELAANAQVVKDREAMEATPLEVGQFIAWAMLQETTRVTDAISHVHRVGLEGLTTCGDVIPPISLWLPLSDALIRTIPHCRFCEMEHARSQGRAA
jgi:hypothetical protein